MSTGMGRRNFLGVIAGTDPTSAATPTGSTETSSMASWGGRPPVNLGMDVPKPIST